MIRPKLVGVSLVFCLVAGLECALGTAASAQNVFVETGWNDLAARLGERNVPTGAGIGVGQVEANSGTAYGPNQASAEFVGKLFTAMSGVPGTSGHATSVANNFYGNNLSLAPGITQVWLYSASGWLQANFLNAHLSSAVLPAIPPFGLRIFNNSWVGTTNDNGVDNLVLRRADFAIRRDNVLQFDGMNNGGGENQALMANGFNGVSVGRLDGNHVTGPTPVGLDGPGRMKPEIVAPGSATSFATPVVSAVTAVLLETAASEPFLLINPNAAHSATIKSVLLAGARHRTGWSNGPAVSGASRGVTSTPMDPVFGVDVVNVDRSHLILTGGEFGGTSDVSSAPVVPAEGWDLVDVASGQSRWYRFNLNSEVDEASVLATWHRVVPTSLSSYTLANFDLRLWRVENGVPVTLVGDPGLPYFSSGNVVSQSAVDNVEHLYLRGLAPGAYAIELDRIDTSAVPVTVALSWLRSPDEANLLGDLNADGVVDGADLGILLLAWGSDDPLADLNGDGIVDGADLGELLLAWS